MARELLMEMEGGEVRAAIMENDSLVDLIVERESGGSIVGNIYLGRVERVITATDRLIARHLAVRLNTVLQAEELPAGVTDLATGLALIAA